MKLALCMVAVLGVARDVASSQQPSPQPVALRELSLEQLGSIEVTTASKQPAEVWRSPAAITVLTQEEIRRSGVTTLAELIRLVAGVQVSRMDSDHWAVGIRGLTNAFSKSLLVLIDGRSVYTPLFGGVYWQVQDTLLEDIDRIEVIRGPGGTIWGSNAVNGVINVITKDTRETTGALVSLGAGNVDQERVGVRYGGLRGAVSYRVYGSGFIRDAEHAFDGHSYDDWRLAQGGFRVDTRRATSNLRVQGDFYKGSMGERVRIGMFVPPSNALVEGLEQVSGGNLLAHWERGLSNGAGIRLQAYFDRTARSAMHFGEDRSTFDVDFLHHTPISSRHQVSWGAGARSSDSQFTQVFPTLTVTPEDRKQNLASVFAEDEIAVVSDRVWVTVGSKFEHNTYSGWEAQPSVRGLWRPHTNETVWAAVSRAVRTPSRIETDLILTLFGTPVPAYLQLAGSKDFSAESLLGVEVGYRRLFGSTFFLDVTAFHNDYDGLAAYSPFTISAKTTPIPHLLVRTDYQNGIDASADGIELAPEWRPASWLRVRSAYALLTVDAVNRPGNSDASNLALYEGTAPRHQGFVHAALTLPRRVEVDYVQRFVGRLVMGDVPRYVTADARLGWQMRQGMTLSIAGQNLFAPNHVEFFRDEFANPGIRRSVSASVTWRP